jgi:hypothetical protein
MNKETELESSYKAWISDTGLDYGKMNEHEKQAANTIACQCIGRHFSKSVSDFLIFRIQMSTEV